MSSLCAGQSVLVRSIEVVYIGMAAARNTTRSVEVNFVYSFLWDGSSQEHNQVSWGQLCLFFSLGWEQPGTQPGQLRSIVFVLFFGMGAARNTTRSVEVNFFIFFPLLLFSCQISINCYMNNYEAELLSASRIKDPTVNLLLGLIG
jgi:hypothetical protein